MRRSLSLVVAVVCFWNGLPDRLAEDAGNAVFADAQAAVRAPQGVPELSGLNLKTTPIQDIRVGQRVLANNPEVSDEERESWVEPDWSQWQQVSLEMPKPDGSLLKIEMLRPSTWLESQAAAVVESREIIAHPSPPEGQVSRDGSHRPFETDSPDQQNTLVGSPHFWHCTLIERQSAGGNRPYGNWGSLPEETRKSVSALIQAVAIKSEC